MCGETDGFQVFPTCRGWVFRPRLWALAPRGLQAGRWALGLRRSAWRTDASNPPTKFEDGHSGVATPIASLNRVDDCCKQLCLRGALRFYSRPKKDGFPKDTFPSRLPSQNTIPMALKIGGYGCTSLFQRTPKMGLLFSSWCPFTTTGVPSLLESKIYFLSPPETTPHG